MKATPLFLATALIGLGAAMPMTFDLSDEMLAKLKTGQSSGVLANSTTSATGTTANEFLDGGCRPVIFFFARGSTQDGNIGSDPGPQTIDDLKAAAGGDTVVAAQGLDYPATLLANLLPQGCDPADASNFAALITQGATQCPTSQLVVSGYSQGAALVHAAAKLLTASVASRVSAAVTFGDTRKKQDGGVIPNIDASRGLILCHDGDLVCDGTLLITDAHSDYDDLAPTAVSFITSKLTL
ncbi:carbohydrate esterase family 5 protein [Xylaria arbuscula]|nr:carbohydrate esterase family 5 protein [Xylaria arbuscula]